MRSFLSRYSGPLILVLGSLGLIAVVPFLGADRSEPPAPPDDSRVPAFPTTTYPGVRQPPAVPAVGAGLNDADEVVGVVVHGKPRAYALKAMQGLPQNHAINDLVGGTPVTVTYCDLGRCVKAFTAAGSEPLAIDVAGFRDGDMLLKVGERTYSQKSGVSVEPRHPGRLPFEAAAFEWTTWKKWRDAHPDTDVVVGVPAAPAGPRHPKGTVPLN